MASNCDDHSKNVSFVLRDRRAWTLAPAYDVVYAYNPKGEWTYQHLMSVNGKFAAITREDLLLLADRFQIGTALKVLDQVRAAVATWPDFALQAKVPAETTQRIREHLSLV
jgi:serine/threonine-protein kinase HipA